MIHGGNARAEVSIGQRTAGWGSLLRVARKDSGEEICDKAPKNVNELDLEVEGRACLAGEKGKGKELGVSGSTQCAGQERD